MTYACQNVADKISAITNNKYVFYVRWGQDVEFESNIAPFGMEARKTILFKFHTLLLLEIDRLIDELRNTTTNLSDIGNTFTYNQWENILKYYQNINIKINSLINYYDFPLKKREKIHRILDELGTYFCCVDVTLNYTSSGFKLTKIRLSDLIYHTFIPMLEDIRDLLSKDYALRT